MVVLGRVRGINMLSRLQTLSRMVFNKCRGTAKVQNAEPCSSPVVHFTTEERPSHAVVVPQSTHYNKLWQYGCRFVIWWLSLHISLAASGLTGHACLTHVGEDAMDRENKSVRNSAVRQLTNAELELDVGNDVASAVPAWIGTGGWVGWRGDDSAKR